MFVAGGAGAAAAAAAGSSTTALGAEEEEEGEGEEEEGEEEWGDENERSNDDDGNGDGGDDNGDNGDDTFYFDPLNLRVAGATGISKAGSLADERERRFRQRALRLLRRAAAANAVAEDAREDKAVGLATERRLKRRAASALALAAEAEAAAAAAVAAGAVGRGGEDKGAVGGSSSSSSSSSSSDRSSSDRSSIALGSARFDPFLFLGKVHARTSFAGLCAGARNLEAAREDEERGKLGAEGSTARLALLIRASVPEFTSLSAESEAAQRLADESAAVGSGAAVAELARLLELQDGNGAEVGEDTIDPLGEEETTLASLSARLSPLLAAHAEEEAILDADAALRLLEARAVRVARG